MGGAVSTGDDNDELVDNLVDANYIKFVMTERVFRAVDRADYFLPEHRESAYKDLAWKHGHLHLSAPCIYSEVLDSLNLEEGLSFLNLGSGTGYLSTMAGLVLGSYGVNHGIDVHEDVIDYARERLEEFKANAPAFKEFDFAEPRFVAGNCLQLASTGRLYDRVYCGAACPAEHEAYMKNLVTVGGVLVMPLNDQLLQIRRTSETEWTTKSILPVSFATLVAPNKDKPDVVDLPEIPVLSLQDVCRHRIRHIVRSICVAEQPGLARPPRRQRAPRRRSHGDRRGRLVNIVPMQMGMMILNSLDTHDISDSDSDDEDDFNDAMDHMMGDGERVFYRNDNSEQSQDGDGSAEAQAGLGGAEGGRDNVGERRPVACTDDLRRARSLSASRRKQLLEDFIKEEPEMEEFLSSDDGELETEEVGSGAKQKPSGSDSPLSSTVNKRGSPTQEDNIDSTFKRMRCGSKDGQTRGKRGEVEEIEEEDDEQQEEVGEVDGGRRGARSSPMQIEQPAMPRRQTRRQTILSSEDSDLENMDMDNAGTSSGSTGAAPSSSSSSSAFNSLHLLPLPRKMRYSSSTSADTSETSGFGSFGESPLGLSQEPDVVTAVHDLGSSIDEEGEGEDRVASLTDTLAVINRKSVDSNDNGEDEGMDDGKGNEGDMGKTKPAGPTLGDVMTERILLLPLPQALRSYLTYYRS